MTRYPSVKAASFGKLSDDYGAQHIQVELARFIVGYNNPLMSRAQRNGLADTFSWTFQAVPVYHKAKLWDVDFPLYRHASDDWDVIHALPARKDKKGAEIPGRFDTALINMGLGTRLGVNGRLYCCAL